jgi:eight-cysteine-cluster-containing protein
MISNHIRYLAAASIASLASIFLGVACGGRALEEQATEVDPVGSDPEELRVQCPRGWVDPNVVQIDCVPGDVVTSRAFNGVICAACQARPEGPRCDLPWVDVSDELECGGRRGEVIYSPRGTCKRCSLDEGGCVQDSDCMRTGCSDQLCDDEEVVTTCEWREEYACYSQRFARCVCMEGQCGWERNRRLAQCLRERRPTAQ